MQFLLFQAKEIGCITQNQSQYLWKQISYLGWRTRDWLAAEPQLTALATVGRLSEKHPEQFETRQHSIVQRLLKAQW
jgi:hypothetical protein